MLVVELLHGLLVAHPLPRVLLGQLLLHLGPALELRARPARLALQLALPAHVFHLCLSELNPKLVVILSQLLANFKGTCYLE